MGWEIKRYGGKIHSGGGGYTEYSGVRFFIGMLVFFSMTFSKITLDKWYGGVYLATWFIYTLIALIPEIIAKLQEYLIIAFSSMTTVLINLYPKWLLFGEYKSGGYDSSGNYQSLWVPDQAAIEIYSVFNIVLIVICVTFMVMRKRRVRSRKS